MLGNAMGKGQKTQCFETFGVRQESRDEHQTRSSRWGRWEETGFF